MSIVYRSWQKNIWSIKLKCSFFEAESVTWLRAEIKVSTFFIFKIPCVFKTNGMSLKNTYSEFKNTSLWKIYTYTNFSSFLYTSFNNFQKGQLPVKFNLFIYKEIPKWEAQYTLDRQIPVEHSIILHTHLTGRLRDGLPASRAALGIRTAFVHLCCNYKIKKRK